MSLPQTCPQCGMELPAGSSSWLCPKCVLANATAGETGEGDTFPILGEMEVASGDGPAEAFPRTLGDYQLLERIGEGGMGVVYKARQVSLDRIVAVKVLPFGQLANKEYVHRFRTEAVAAGSLQHPNVVGIHEVGLDEGQHYLVMDYVAGPTLAELAREGPLPAGRAARYVQLITEAVHFAHERNILHRDLKPSNVLIDANDQPRVTDFGLAKRLETGVELTLSGQVLGSPGYMPPEQASGQRGCMGRRSDVYSLGAILYHLLTGRPPFVGPEVGETLRQLLNDEPVAPRLLNPKAPVDLETICLKCLEKEPARRYSTAQALAEELGRYLRDEPILSRPVGQTQKVWRWCHRKPALAGLGAGVILLFLAIAIGLPLALYQINRARVNALAQRERAELNLYAADINLAERYLKEGRLGQVLDLLDRHTAGGSASPPWEWRHLRNQCRSEAEFVLDRLGTPCQLTRISADGRYLAGTERFGKVHLWDLRTRRRIASVGDNWPRGVGCVRLSSDGRFLAYHEQSPGQPAKAVVWDVEARTRYAELGDPNYLVAFPFGFVPGASELIAGRLSAQDGSRNLVLWDFSTGRIKTSLTTGPTQSQPGDMKNKVNLAFTPDGSQSVNGDTDGRIVILNAKTLELVEAFQAHEQVITDAVLSPDGRVLATAQAYQGSTIQLWDFPTRQPLAILEGHTGEVLDLDFGADGRLLASASADQTVRIWDVVTRKEVRRFLGHKTGTMSVEFSPDGRRLYSADLEGMVCAFSFDGPPRPTGPFRRQLRLSTLSVSPDGSVLAGVGQDGSACLLEPASGGVLASFTGLGTNNTEMAFSGDGRWLFVAKESGEIIVWDLERQRLIRRLGGVIDTGLLEASRDGQWLVAIESPSRVSREHRMVVALDEPGRIHLWQTATWTERTWPETRNRAPARIHCIALSPNGRWLATGLDEGWVQVRELPTGLLERALQHGDEHTGDLAFSPDGQRLAALSWAGTVTVWETHNWRELVCLRPPHQPQALAFSADSRRLALGSRHREVVKVWDTATWRELVTLEAEGGKPRELLFTPDDRWLLGLTRAGEILVWDAPSWAELLQIEKTSLPTRQ